MLTQAPDVVRQMQLAFAQNVIDAEADAAAGRAYGARTCR